MIGVAVPVSAKNTPVSAGQALYRQGILPNGANLEGHREAGGSISGGPAACVNCHHRSGLGSIEGDIVIPPIIAKYLFRTRVANAQDLDLPHVPGYTAHDWTYTDQSLAQAIRTGARPNGGTLSTLMPRYDLDDSSMAVLIEYLKDLTSKAVPGVSDTTLDFATIITPDADPVEKQAMLTVLQRFFAVQQNVIAAETRPLRSSREIMYRVTRKWHLHVWELKGASGTWGQQLDQHLASEPVFAVISGLGRGEWRPVHDFCVRNALPCLLPNVDLPVVAENDFYPLYYSRGVLLEADLIGTRLWKPDAKRPARLVQLYRADDIGRSAAAALAEQARSKDLVVEQRELPAAPHEQNAKARAAALARALRGARDGDAVVLWLRPEDIKALGTVPKVDAVYASGLMAGLEAAPLPAQWRPITEFSYPYDPPEVRRVRMNFPLGWFRVQNIPLTAERVQSNTYLSCVILSEVLGHMLDSFVRDYLVERLEMTLSLRLVNGYFPRLGLAPGQRFASKGGYLVHFGTAGAGSVVTDGGWITP